MSLQAARRDSTRRRWAAQVAAASVAGVLLSAWACGAGTPPTANSQTKDPPTILIGAPQPLTGFGAAFGVPQIEAAQLVVKMINANGGIKELGGAKLKLIVEDDQSSPTVAAQEVRQLASQHVSALIGPILSENVVANAPLIQQLKIPLLSPSLDDRVTENNKGYIFRTVNRASAWAAEAGQFIKYLSQQYGTPISRIGVVGINVPPGTSSDDVMQSVAQKNGWTVTRIDYDQKTTTDFAPIVAKLKAANVQLVTGYQNPNDAVAFAKAVAAQSWRPEYGFVWISGGQYLNSFESALGASAIDGWMDVSYTGGLTTSSYGTAVQNVANEYLTQYKEPLDGVAGSEGATISILADAIAKAKSTDPIKIAQAARQLSFQDGVTQSEYPYFTQAGGVSFDNNQDNTAWLGPVIQWENGQQVVVYPQSVATTKPTWPENMK